MRIALLLGIIVCAESALAQLPSEGLPVSGVLEDAAGLPVAGPVNLTFRIYDSRVGGVPLWQELHPAVPLGPEGRYSVRLGEITALTAGLFDTPDRWLGIEVAADGEMNPRLWLSPAPFAHNSELLDGSPASTFAPRAELADATPATTPVGWLDLFGVPADLADGDDDTTYAAGIGLQLMGPTFSADFAGTGTAGTVARSDHSHAGVYVAPLDLSTSDGSPPNLGSNRVHWDILNGVPADIVDGDQDTTYSEGSGIDIAGSVIAAEFAGSGLANTVARSDHDHPGLQSQIDDLQMQVALLMGGGGGGGGGLNFPDGTAGITAVTRQGLLSGPYVVPAGMNLYVLEIYSLSTSYWLTVDGATVVRGFSAYGDSQYSQHLDVPIVVGAGQTLASNSDSPAFNGFLVAATVTPMTRTGLLTSGYTVPAGKVLVITGWYSLSTSYWLTIDGVTIARGFSSYGDSAYHQRRGQPLVAGPGQVVACNSDSPVWNGYLRNP